MKMTDVELEAALLGQEHRIFFVVKNYWNRGKYDKSDPRYDAVVSALLWRSVQAIMPAAATGSVGLVGIFGLYLAFQANKLLEEQNTFIQKQNEALDQQQTEIKVQFRQTERTRLLQMLYDPSENVVQGATEQPTQFTPAQPAGTEQNQKPRWNSRLRGEATKAFVEIERSVDYKQRDEAVIFLGRALLGEVVLDNFNLSKVNFWKADLSNASLRKAILTGADFSHADLRQADLTGADLQEADLHACLLSQCLLTNANLTKAKLTACPDSTVSDYRNTDLTKASLREAILNEADLSDANLNGVDLTNASLRGAKLDRAQLTDAILRGVDVRGVDFTNVELTGAIVDRQSPGFQVLDSKVKEAGWVLSPSSGTDFILSRPLPATGIR